MKPDFHQSRSTEIIYNLIKNISERADRFIPWSELTTATEKTRDEIRGSLGTAIKRCRRNDGIVIEVDRKLGVRLVENGNLPKSGMKAVERARRTQKVGLEKVNCADISKLNMEQKAEYNVTRTVLELGLQASRPRTIENVKKMVIRQNNYLDVEHMLQATKEALMK
jgi:hypothetical protein